MELKFNTKQISELIGIRESVLKFAELMELRLKENDEKGGWSENDIWHLYERLCEEKDELFEAILKIERSCLHSGIIDVRVEAADTANFAMMIADNVAGS